MTLASSPSLKPLGLSPGSSCLLQPQHKGTSQPWFFFKRERVFIRSSVTQRSFWKNTEPGRCPHLRRPLWLLLSQKHSQELARVHSCNAFSRCAQSEVISGCFLISPDTLRSPSHRLVSALNRAKFREIKAVEELHPHCSPPSPLHLLLSPQ